MIVEMSEDPLRCPTCNAVIHLTLDGDQVKFGHVPPFCAWVEDKAAVKAWVEARLTAALRAS